MPAASVLDIIKDPKKLRGLFGSTPVLIGPLQVDVLEEETPIFEWDLPTRRVDAGFDVTDSRYSRPVGVTLDCVFLDLDISLSGAIAAAAGFGFDSSKWVDKKDALHELASKNELITIITPSGNDYSDMMIESIMPTHTPETRNGYWFRLTARRVEIVSSEVRGADASLIPDALKPQENKTADQRKEKAKNPKQTSQKPVDEKKRQSILTKMGGGIKEAFGGLFG